MSAQMKDVVAAWVSFEADEFKNDKTMIKKLPAELKHKILRYLKEPEPDTVADMPLIDPVTGKTYDRTNILRVKDGFEWSTAEIYMFEHYDVILSDDFLRMFMVEGVNN